MAEPPWAEVDAYLTEKLVGEDDALRAARDASEAAGLPSIAVTPPIGKLLHLIARVMGVRRILEIGLLGGYSTIWLARSLPPRGSLVTLEIDPRHARVARKNLDRAGVLDCVEIRLGPASETLAALVEEAAEPFDLVFIDADKERIADYFTSALKLVRPGAMVIVDNVVRKGAVLDADLDDAQVQGVRRFNDLVAAETRASATTIQTVGGKGYDGLAFVVIDRPASRP